MLKKFLREVVGIVLGKPSEEIADLLNSKKHVNEFLIAKKLDITINQTRNLLYRLSDYWLVSSIRKKDKKKGWYTYFWKIEVLKCLEFLRDFLLKRIGQFRNQLNSRETKQFYVCKRCDIEFNEENALLNDFTCNECGDVFDIKDNTKVVKELKKNLDRLETELKLVEEEIKKECFLISKQRDKEMKKEAKRKAEESAKKRVARKKEREAAKKNVKKPSKKVDAKMKKMKKTLRAVKKGMKKTVKKTVKKKTKNLAKKILGRGKTSILTSKKLASRKKKLKRSHVKKKPVKRVAKKSVKKTKAKGKK